MTTLQIYNILDEIDSLLEDYNTMCLEWLVDPTDVLDEIDCSWEKAYDPLLEVCHCWL